MYKLTSSISTLDGDGCQVKLLNRKLRVVENIDPNSVNYFDDINKITFVGITVFPHTTIKINEINIEYEYDKEQDISKTLMVIYYYFVLAIQLMIINIDVLLFILECKHTRKRI